MEKLLIKCPSFKDNGWIPIKHTGFGKDISPEFQLLNLDDKAISIVIIMDDCNIPLIKKINHWVIWNIPKMEVIPENIEPGARVINLENAVQGIGYGKNRYKGPKQPFFIKNAHNYKFSIYALDCFLNLNSNSRSNKVIKAMEGHILQSGSIFGKYKREN